MSWSVTVKAIEAVGFTGQIRQARTTNSGTCFYNCSHSNNSLPNSGLSHWSRGDTCGRATLHIFVSFHTTLLWHCFWRILTCYPIDEAKIYKGVFYGNLHTSSYQTGFLPITCNGQLCKHLGCVLIEHFLFEGVKRKFLCDCRWHTMKRRPCLCVGSWLYRAVLMVDVVLGKTRGTETLHSPAAASACHCS